MLSAIPENDSVTFSEAPDSPQPESDTGFDPFENLANTAVKARSALDEHREASERLANITSEITRSRYLTRITDSYELSDEFKSYFSSRIEQLAKPEASAIAKANQTELQAKESLNLLYRQSVAILPPSEGLTDAAAIVIKYRTGQVTSFDQQRRYTWNCIFCHRPPQLKQPAPSPSLTEALETLLDHIQSELASRAPG